MSLSGVWASVFTLQAVLLVVAGIARRDLVIRPRRDLSSGLGAAFIGYALIGYPLVGMLGGHALRIVPLFGVSQDARAGHHRPSPAIPRRPGPPAPQRQAEGQLGARA